MRAIFASDVEEALKEEFFEGSAPGFFVEVGANAPQTWSQTWQLERLGWTGILIEPQPDLAERLRQQRRAKVFAVACSSPVNAGSTMRLHVAGIHSSLDPDFFVYGGRREGVIEVPIRTLDDILVEANAPVPIDFLSIDVEGHEIDVLRGFDLQRWHPRLILIEDQAMDLVRHRFLQSRGYRWVRRTGLNAWYVPADSPMQVALFGQLQFIRKYYLGAPFRRIREVKRRALARWRRQPWSR